MRLKRCGRCKETKELVDFPKNCTHSDGLSYWCRACTNAHAAKRRKRGFVSTYTRVMSVPKRVETPVPKAVMPEAKKDKWELMLLRLKEGKKVSG